MVKCTDSDLKPLMAEYIAQPHQSGIGFYRFVKDRGLRINQISAIRFYQTGSRYSDSYTLDSHDYNKKAER